MCLCACTFVALQGLQVAVAGNVGTSHPPSSSCSVTAVSLAVYSATPAGEPGTQLHAARVNLAANAFAWSSNESTVLVFDILNESDGIHLPLNSAYWLSLQLIAAYGGSDGNGQCYAFVGTSSTAWNTTMQARWQESGGFMTSCTRAGSRVPTSGQVRC
jgi:hypothetical protein